MEYLDVQQGLYPIPVLFVIGIEDIVVIVQREEYFNTDYYGYHKLNLISERY